MKKIFISHLLIILSITYAFGHATPLLNEYVFAFEKLIVYYKDLEVGLQSTVNLFINNVLSSLPQDSLKEQLINEYTRHFTSYNDYEFLQLSLAKKSSKNGVSTHNSPSKSHALDPELEDIKNLFDSINTDISSANDLVNTASATAADIKNEASKLNSSAKGDTTLKSISKHLKSQGNKLQKQVKKTKANMEDELNATKFLNEELSQLFNNHDFVDDHHLAHHEGSDRKGSKIDHYFNFILKLNSKISHLNLSLDDLSVDTLSIQQPAQNILNVVSTLDDLRGKGVPEQSENKGEVVNLGEQEISTDHHTLADEGTQTETAGEDVHVEHKDEGTQTEEHPEERESLPLPPGTPEGDASNNEPDTKESIEEPEEHKQEEPMTGTVSESKPETDNENKLGGHPEEHKEETNPSTEHKPEEHSLKSEEHKPEDHNHETQENKVESHEQHKPEEPAPEEHKSEEHKPEEQNTNMPSAQEGGGNLGSHSGDKS